MVDKITHIFIVLVLPTKSVLKHCKHVVHNIHRLVWGAYARGTPSQLPGVHLPQDGTALIQLLLNTFAN